MTAHRIQRRLVTRHGRVYDVLWDSVTGDVRMTGLPGSLTDAGVSISVGRASSEDEAMRASEAAAYKRLSNFDKYVGGTTMGKSEVIAVHLLLEHLLIRCLHAVLPNPDPVFRGRPPSFFMLISLCEAHRVISGDLAEVLRAVNTLRNKCAHHMVFDPSDSDLEPLAERLRVIYTYERGAPDERVDPWPLLCELVEERARAVGATDI
jgi:hypothetical protein